MRNPLALTLLAALAACSGSETPGHLTLTVGANPNSVLAARVDYQTSGALTLEVTFRKADGGGPPTASVPLDASLDGRLEVLELEPSTSYLVTARAHLASGKTVSVFRGFTTGPLPAALQRLALKVGAGATPPGYLLIDVAQATSPAVVVAYDYAGRLRWYRTFDPDGPAADTKQLPGGNFVAYLGTSTGSAPAQGVYVEFTPAGDEVRRMVAPAGYDLDPHELLITDEGTAAERHHFFGYDSRYLNWPDRGWWTTFGHTIFRTLADGTVEWSWSAWDHLGLAESVDAMTGQGGVDYDHPNSLEIDASGDYLVSFRNLDAVLKIDGRTGDLLWRLGGTLSTFTFVDDPVGGFAGQHTAHTLPNGHLLLFDNGFWTGVSRAVEYELDHLAGTARLVWEGHRSPDIQTPFMGSATPMQGGVLVGFAMTGYVDLIDASGAVTWEGLLTRDGQPTMFYRALPIASLTEFRAP